MANRFIKRDHSLPLDKNFAKVQAKWQENERLDEAVIIEPWYEFFQDSKRAHVCGWMISWEKIGLEGQNVEML